ncbi:MAG TPA: hypothetical protein VKK30_07140, partial [Actinomycetota bacterium]|nr:hypothetical protein [Actinomycetota bacterium]
RQQVARTLEIEPDDVAWMPSVTSIEESLLAGREWADVVVLSPGVKDPDAIGLAEFMVRTSPTTSVVLVRDRSPNGMLPVFMRSGIRDVVDLSRGTLELREALERAISWSANLRVISLENGHQEKQQRGVVFSVFSSKGGTGKTFLTVNLAAALAEMTKQDVAFLDLEFGVGDSFSYFGKEPTRPLQDLVSIGDLEGKAEVKALGTQLYGTLWGFGSAPDPSAVPLSGEVVGKVARSLRSNFDYLMVDGTTEYTDPVLAALDLSDEICLVTGLDVVGVRHLLLALHTLLSLGYSREQFRIVLNRANSKVGLSPEDVERVAKIKIDAMLPSSRLVPASLNQGKPVVLAQPQSEISTAVRKLAQKLAPDSAPAVVPKKGLRLRRR